MTGWEAIGDALGLHLAKVVPASGGCINQSATLFAEDGSRTFAKANTLGTLSIFEAEAEALEALAATGTIRVPRPIASGTTANEAYLALEHIELGAPHPGSWQQFGRDLAALHRHTATAHGWHRDNVIGATRQPNPSTRSWSDFFVHHRLTHQFELASANGIDFEQSEALLQHASKILAGHRPSPALLHGDLWSGNAGFDDQGAPVIFDPATYYGDPETDLAFTEMFGGFPAPFYAAYDETIPPALGRSQRRRLYNLYHLLNHANLFGGSYIPSSRAAIDDILAVQ